MQYQVSDKEKYQAKLPHNIFNLNIILVHLAAAQLILDLSHGNHAWFLLIPFVSSLIIFYLYKKAHTLNERGDSWFVAANWTLAWRRGRMMLISYVVALSVILISSLLGSLSGGLMMNDFSADDTSSSIIEKIGLFFAAAVIFFTALINFILSGISIYDVSKGEIDEKIEKYAPRTDTSNSVILTEANNDSK